MRNTPLAVVTLVASVAACAACHRDEDPPSAARTLSLGLPPAPAPPPRDHLQPGELVEGKEVAFGLRLPRGTTVTSAFPQQIMAEVPAKTTDVANYVRARVQSGTVSVGAASTDFSRVQVKENLGPELVIRVEPLSLGQGSKITLRDVTPPPFDPSLTPEQRWKQAGLTPGGGGNADPTHLH